MTEHPLVATRLAADSRVAEAKQLLIDAVKDHQRSLTDIRPSNPALKQSYEDLLADFAKCRGGKLWFPYLGSGIGHGCLVELLDGSVKYDFINGIGPHYLGHSHPALISACIDAAISDTVMQGHLQQNGDSVAFALALAKAANLDHCFLTTSGAMANENGLKIAFQKRSPAHRLLAFEKCFAGRSLAMAQITDKPSFRDGLPTNIPVDYIPFFDAKRPEESTEEAVNALKGHLARYPKQHAAMIFELVQGENGFYPGSHNFFAALMQFLKEHHVSILVDEIQTFGRTASLFAFQHFKLESYVDIVTIGKLSQACATLFNHEHNPRPGLLSQTFTGSTSAIHAGKVVLDHLLEGGYFGPEGKINKIHHYFSLKLEEIAKRHPGLIQGPFGIGAMIAFTPFDGNTERTTRFVHALFEAGVISFIAGSHPARVRFLVPAGAITTKDIDRVVSIIEKTLLNEA